MSELKHYTCTKCGSTCKSDNDPGMCVAPFSLRISGICGGSFIETKSLPNYQNYYNEKKDN
jgi:hypothetical protein